MRNTPQSAFRRAILHSIACAVVIGALTPSASAQAFPDRPIRLIVPFPPGGPTDILARILTTKLPAFLGQPVVVENRGGANGNIGAAVAAQAESDGYTVLFATASIAIAPSMYKSLSYDVLKDFAAVAQVSSVPSVLLVHPDSPQTVKGIIDLLKQKPGALTYASSGNGSPAHLTTELFKMETKTDVAHVAYRGSAPAMQGLAAKNHPFMFETLSSIKPLVDSGHLRAIAIASEKRSPLAPDLPTLAELGVPRVTGGTWNMVFVPAGTPPAVIEKINSAFNGVLSDKDVARRLGELAIEANSESTPASAASFLRDEMDRWSKVVRESGARIE